MIEPKKQIPESGIESKLLYKLKELGYTQRIDIKTNKDIENNIKSHLERLEWLKTNKLNNERLSDVEFQTYIINTIKNMDVFSVSKKFRDIFVVKRPNRENIRLACLDFENFENNVFEFSNQIRSERKYVNISDVSIFMNGFPICQIELKRSGVDIYEAFNQIARYKVETFDNNMNKFIQIFVVSNKETTRYFSNNKKIRKEFIFPWSDDVNNPQNNLFEFSDSFFKKETLFKLITKYIVLEETKLIKILRPYQYHAIEKILTHISDTNELNNTLIDLDQRSRELNAYVFHATGSGKTLTSFKLCELLRNDPDISKVIFLVDRLDLNTQTINEFNKFAEEDLDPTENTKKLSLQLKDSNSKLIVTTIHKLNRLIEPSDNNKNNFIKENQELTNSNIVFIIDECHRSQFGDMHKNIRTTFSKARLIGFTGTPIIKGNENDRLQITSDMFGQEIHKYMMVNAIDDLNVLPFKIEYIGGPKNKLASQNDIKVESIDIEEFFKDSKYIDVVGDYIYKSNDNLTHKRRMKSMLVCSSIESAISYYWYFRNSHPDLNIATLFSFIDNDKNIDLDKHSKHELEKIIEDYNKTYQKDYSTKTFKEYSLSVQSDLINNEGKINLIIVVKMLTTGFNCPSLNTIYLDRTLKTHELIQTISRVNRVYDSRKAKANIVSFRTYKHEVDRAIRLYNNKELAGFIDKGTLDEMLTKINSLIDEMKLKWPTADDAQNSQGDERKLEFIGYIKQINKLLNIASSFIEYNPSLINITEDELSTYRSVQKIFAKRIAQGLEKESILGDIDFEIEIISVDDIDVDHILNLLEGIDINTDDFQLKLDGIIAKLRKSTLKSKAELIEKFINQWSRNISEGGINTREIYAEFKLHNVSHVIEEFAKQNKLDFEVIKEVFKSYQLEGKNIQTYSEKLRKSKSIELLTYREKKEAVKKIKKFIVDLDEGFELYGIQEQKIVNNKERD